ncbi:MAG TPA: S8 family serine peptidase [Longimicrobiaceae bacterium]|nr:S8 family serine peptidase [Longimicrobiaceae bacterium]
MKRYTPLLLAAALGIAACSDQNPTALGRHPAVPAANAAVADFVPGQIIVRFRPSTDRVAVTEAYGAHHRENMLLPRTEILQVPEGQELAVAEEMGNDPNVEFAEPDWIAKVGPCEVSATCTLPDGAFFHYKWDLHNTGTINDLALGFGLVNTGKADADMDWAEAYDYLGGNSFSGSAVIAILDTGIRSTHIDFTGKILGGRRFLGDAQPITNFADDHGHGSHVAGIAAALGTSAVPGVAYGANIKLLVGKVCNAAGSCPTSAVANGIVWAADNGANVINMSLGSFGGAPDGSGSAAQQAALQYAAGKNVLPVCASGNDANTPGNGYTGGVGYPARFPECMAVGATSWSDTRASYSNFGPQLAVTAPGGDSNPTGSPFSFILSASASSNTGFVWQAGTSMATPEVAGLAALLWATGIHDAAQIRQRIIDTADDLGTPGWDQFFGAGRVNVYRAITGVSANAAPVANPGGAYTGSKGTPVQFDGSGSRDPNGKAITYAWNFGDPTSGSNTSALQKPTHTYLRAGAYTVTLTVTDASGRTGTATTTATIPNVVPSVTALPGATILPGEGYAASGSFSDPDPDTWTATVNYGDGGGAQALALAGGTFSIAHTYGAAGSFTVTVAVSDNDGGTGTSSATVNVLTPQQGIDALLAQVGVTHPLAVKLNAAKASLDRGNETSALNQLGAFLNQVDAMVRSGQMPAADGAALTAYANRVIAAINL